MSQGCDVWNTLPVALSWDLSLYVLQCGPLKRSQYSKVNFVAYILYRTLTAHFGFARFNTKDERIIDETHRSQVIR